MAATNCVAHTHRTVQFLAGPIDRQASAVVVPQPFRATAINFVCCMLLTQCSSDGGDLKSKTVFTSPWTLRHTRCVTNEVRQNTYASVYRQYALFRTVSAFFECAQSLCSKETMSQAQTCWQNLYVTCLITTHLPSRSCKSCRFFNKKQKGRKA